MSPNRYHAAAITLHWLLAVALAFQLSLGWALEGPNSPELFARYQLHKSVGVTILLLTVIRLAIRFTVPRPAPTEGPFWARALASTVHAGFYLVMIAAPLAGWLIVSTAKIQVPTLLYGVVPLPHLPVGRAWHEPAEGIHEALAWLAVALFVLHVAGALRHQWLLGKPELQRMIPLARGRAIPAAIAALLLIVAGLIAGKLAFPNRAQAEPTAPAAVMTPARTAAPAPVTEIVPAAVENAQQAIPVEETQPIADWTVRPGGRLGFTASWNGEAINGRFDRWRAAIRFSPDALGDSRIRVTVDLASANTEDSQRDDSLKSSDFFDTASHPTATFTARDIRDLEGDRYEARGTLELRGVSKPATLRFTLRIDGDKARVSGTSRIDRTDFGVGQGEWAATDAIAAGVDIAFSFTATRPAS
ncbi:YceI family protein [Sphingomonas sp. LaA6.9]|uniref:YceI family protein n=1 Tax=Sphingomonas sp. LaA6.9 TaxID=2919914 RepID=UPI001F4F58B1|nr:YceI family protein [Sphingomonas sp. LaA6.9]MCJ8157435.1 YceI family protein [Sphingomonas sp. LaA6.9]